MAYDSIFPAGSTSKMIEVMVRDSTTGMGKTGLAFGSVTFSYWRAGAATGVTATCVDAALGTWTTKGWKENDATSQKGVYQFGIPNGALAAGVDAVTINFQASGMIDKSLRILIDPKVALSDSIPTTAPTGVASTFREMAVQVWRNVFKKSTFVPGTGAKLTFDDAGTGVLTTQTFSDDGTTQTKGAAS